jgi:hypothetical protein
MLTGAHSPAAAGVRGVFFILKKNILYCNIRVKLSQLFEKIAKFEFIRISIGIYVSNSEKKLMTVLEFPLPCKVFF